ncbi:MAG: cobalt ECF transporter T component CbiQ [Clostridiales bacterium]|jgi:cobalt/nickel transport system permease protein|nr:cobalt ECF transporter T component CbiQ [Eubacteriales bacterium]MDH7566201.1 cobalt ECF transporter T component CbiQ [Clostridiales bacterium]
MINIDNYAYLSKLKKTDPMQKLLFALLTLGVCLWANSIAISVLVLFIMGWVTVCRGGTPPALFMKLLLVPMSFLVIGVLTIAVNASDNPGVFIFSVYAAGTHIGVSLAGIHNAVRLFFKALGAVSCLYYLSLSTPMVDLLGALRRLKVPKLLVELMGLIYRFIFVLLETADTMHTAQDSRLGYSSLSSGYRSLGALASTLFIRAYKRSDELYTALEARGYDGELNVLEEPFNVRWTGYAAAVLVNLALILAALLMPQLTGGLL